MPPLWVIIAERDNIVKLRMFEEVSLSLNLTNWLFANDANGNFSLTLQ